MDKTKRTQMCLLCLLFALVPRFSQVLELPLFFFFRTVLIICYLFFDLPIPILCSNFFVIFISAFFVPDKWYSRVIMAELPEGTVIGTFLKILGGTILIAFSGIENPLLDISATVPPEFLEKYWTKMCLWVFTNSNEGMVSSGETLALQMQNTSQCKFTVFVLPWSSSSQVWRDGNELQSWLHCWRCYAKCDARLRGSLIRRTFDLISNLLIWTISYSGCSRSPVSAIVSLKKT